MLWASVSGLVFILTVDEIYVGSKTGMEGAWAWMSWAILVIPLPSFFPPADPHLLAGAKAW